MKKNFNLTFRRKRTKYEILNKISDIINNDSIHSDNITKFKQSLISQLYGDCSLDLIYFVTNFDENNVRKKPSPDEIILWEESCKIYKWLHHSDELLINVNSIIYKSEKQIKIAIKNLKNDLKHLKSSMFPNGFYSTIHISDIIFNIEKSIEFLENVLGVDVMNSEFENINSQLYIYNDTNIYSIFKWLTNPNIDLYFSIYACTNYESYNFKYDKSDENYIDGKIHILVPIDNYELMCEFNSYYNDVLINPELISIRKEYDEVIEKYK